jgi:magnesium transporter
MHAVDFRQVAHEFNTTELNLFLGKNFLVTFHDDPVQSVTATREMVKKNPAVIARAPDRLTYYILDLLLDNFAPSLDQLSDDITELDKNVLKAPSMEILNDILHLKSEVQRLRQILGPQRDVMAKVAHGEFSPMRTSMLPYYRDLLDRLVRYSDMAETYRESLSNTVQILLNLQQSQTNQVVKVLTVLATLSMPLLIVTSFYGMNFNHWPTMASPIAYPWVFALTGLTTLGLYWFLKRKNWL